MKNTDRKELQDILVAAYELHGKAVTPSTTQLWFRILEPYAIEDVSRAISQIMATSAYLPKPAEVVDILNPSQWPTPAEAWAIYPHDERATGAVCDATQAAWASAEGLWEAGDLIGARRAFEGAYTRHMEEAKASGIRRPTWRISFGWDANLRSQGIHEARLRGLLSQEQVQGYLGDDERQEQIERHVPEGRQGLQPVGRLLGGAATDGAEGGVRKGVGRVEGGKQA